MSIRKGPMYVFVLCIWKRVNVRLAGSLQPDTVSNAAMKPNANAIKTINCMRLMSYAPFRYRMLDSTSQSGKHCASQTAILKAWLQSSVRRLYSSMLSMGEARRFRMIHWTTVKNEDGEEAGHPVGFSSRYDTDTDSKLLRRLHW